MLYILDEPSIGLHPRDNDRLLDTLAQLRDQGNTVVVVEHDEDTMRAADHIVDFGPGPGVRGGEVVAAGPVGRRDRRAARASPASICPASGGSRFPQRRRPLGDKRLRSSAAPRTTTSRTSTSRFRWACSSASRASPARARARWSTTSWSRPCAATSTAAIGNPGAHAAIDGLEHLDKLIAIDQSPIGRTPRSNPATYIKVFDEIRNLYTQLPESKARGYKPGRFSFNVAGGRCEACEGNGSNRLEMDFLADVWVTCPVCEGHRFNRETLQVRFKGKSIADVLEMDVQEALAHFENIPAIRHKLQTLHDVGLDYMKLGQPSPTLSGGEAQRIKLARELVKKSTGRTLYLLDEPTTGLHFADIELLLKVLHDFVDAGNTVLVVEHNLDVIKTADWIIDLGPEGGAAGGRIVAAGTPEDSRRATRESYTGQALRRVLEARRPASRRWQRQRQAERPHGQAALGDAAGHCHQRPRRPAAQPEGHRRRHPPRPADRLLRPERLGQELAGHGHDLRRRPAALRRKPQRLRPAVRRPDAEAASSTTSRACRRPSPSSRSTSGHTPRIDRRHGDRDLRLPADSDVPAGHSRTARPATCRSARRSADEIIDKIMAHPAGTKLYLMAPLEIHVGERVRDAVGRDPRARATCGSASTARRYSVDQPPADRPPPQARRRGGDRPRDGPARRPLADRRQRRERPVAGHAACCTWPIRSDDVPEPHWPVEIHSQHFACDRCGRSFEPLTPHNFSFNSPLGWCPACEGLGTQTGTNPAALLRDPKLTLAEGAVALWPTRRATPLFALMLDGAVARSTGIPLDVPFDQLDGRAAPRRSCTAPASSGSTC